MIVDTGEAGLLAAVRGADLGGRVDRGLHDAEQEPVPVRDALRVGRSPQPLPLGVGVGLTLLLGAHPVGDVVLDQVADGGRAFAASRVGVPEQGQVDAEVPAVVLAGPLLDARQSVDVAGGPRLERHVAGDGGLLDESLAADPAVRPLVAVRLDQLLEGLGVLGVAEFFGFLLAVLAPLHLVGGAAVLLGPFHDARHEGTIRPGSDTCVPVVFPSLWT
ncbi:hypothetical protein [Streptomyces pulveraceus]|uniref:Uncharacterized protein n=1 Tax=Streptomyces pulveraceus TaxID=68258 RepID=A0ABW1GMH0_9ACTN